MIIVLCHVWQYDNISLPVTDSQLFNQNNIQHVTYAIFVIIW